MLLTIAKVTLLLVAVLLVARFTPGLSSASRHTLIVAGLVAALLIPLLETFLPTVYLAVLPNTELAAPLRETNIVAPVQTFPQTDARTPSSVEGQHRILPPPAPGRADVANSVRSNRPGSIKTPSFSPGTAAGIIWIFGFLFVTLRFAVSRRRIARLALKARPVTSGEWSKPVAEVTRSMGLNDTVVLESPDEIMPMAWGIFKGTVLVPRSGRCWPLARRRAVLAHELSHLARRDGLWQLLSRLACATYWFNPIVWMADRQMLLHRERASDDMVLQAGARASDYANQLLAVATELKPIPQLENASLAMAHRSELGDRLKSILSPQVRRGMSKRFLALVCLFFVFTTTSVAVAHPVKRRADAPSPPPTPETSIRVDGSEATKLATPETGFEETLAEAPASATNLPASSQRVERNRSRQSERDSTEYRSRRQDGDYTIEIRGRGEVTLSDDDRSIVSIADDGYIVIREEDRDHDYRLEVRSVSGTLEYRWRVDGDNRDFDAEGERWFADALESLIYELGFAADARVARILEDEGADGIYDEIRKMESDFVQAKYFIAMLNGGSYSAEEIRTGLRLSRDEINSDFEQARILMLVGEEYMDEPATRTEFVRAAQALESDFEMGRVLKSVVSRQDLSPEVIGEILEITDALESDFELSNVLTSLAEAHELDEGLQRTYLERLQSIGSDFEVRRPLMTLLENGGLTDANFDMALEGIEFIESDFEQSQILTSMLTERELTPSQQATLLRQVSNIESDFEQKRVLMLLMDQPSLTSQTELELLRMSTQLGSDFERSSFLLATSDRFMMDDAARDLYLDAASDIGSDFEIRRVLGAVIEGRQLNDEQLQGVMNAGRSIESDHELSELLRSIADTYDLSPTLRELYEDVADQISSDFDYGRAMGGIRRSRR